jgi:H+/Cl- antiporter ClcA
MNVSLWAISIGTLVALLLVLYVPPLTRLFHFSAVHPSDIFTAVTAGCLGVLWFEALKLVTGKRLHHNPAEAGK